MSRSRAALAAVAATLMLAACGSGHHPRREAAAPCALTPVPRPAALAAISRAGLSAPGRVRAAFRLPADATVVPAAAGGAVYFTEPGPGYGDERVGWAGPDGHVQWERVARHLGLRIAPTQDGLVVTSSLDRVMLLDGDTGAIRECARINPADQTPLIDGDAAVFVPPGGPGTKLVRLTLGAARMTDLDGTPRLLASTGDLAVFGRDQGAGSGTEVASGPGWPKQIDWVRGGKPAGSHAFLKPAGPALAGHLWTGEQVLGVTSGGLTIVRDQYEATQRLPDGVAGAVAAVRTDGSVAWHAAVAPDYGGAPAQVVVDGGRVETLTSLHGVLELTLLDAATGRALGRRRIPDRHSPEATTLEPNGWLFTPELVASFDHPHPISVPEALGSAATLTVGAASADAAVAFKDRRGRDVVYVLTP